MVDAAGNAPRHVNQWPQATIQGQRNSAANSTYKPTPGLAFKPGGAPAPAAAPKQKGPLATINSAFEDFQRATAAHDAALDKLHEAQDNKLPTVTELRAKFSEASRALDSARLSFYLVVAHKIDELRSGKDDFTSAYVATERLDKAVLVDGNNLKRNVADSRQIAVREQSNSYLLIFAEDKLKALVFPRVSSTQRAKVIADVASWVVTRQDYPSPTDSLPIARLSSILYFIKNLAAAADKGVSAKLQTNLAGLQTDLVNACRRKGMQIPPDQQQELNVSLIAPDKK
jgi:hypothetical protein